MTILIYCNLYILQRANLTDIELQKVKDLILNDSDIFCRGNNYVACTNQVKHKIDLIDEQLFNQRFQSISLSMYDEVRTQLRQFLDNGIIRHSRSPFASNVVLGKKKNWSLRMCVD